MVRTTTLLALCSLATMAGCSGSKSSDTASATSTGVTDTAADTNTDTQTGANEPHPLVPEEFQWLWDTDGCTTLDGQDGVNVYWYAQGSADENGVLTMTEDWFWFLGKGDVNQDCVDTFSITGVYDAFDYAALGCGACEEGYAVTRTLTKSNCNLSYHTSFGVEEEPKEQVYEAIEMFDTLTAAGNANWENVMDVSHADPYPPGQNKSYIVAFNWSRGHAFPTGDPGYPAAYDWVGEACYTIK